MVFKKRTEETVRKKCKKKRLIDQKKVKVKVSEQTKECEVNRVSECECEFATEIACFD